MLTPVWVKESVTGQEIARILFKAGKARDGYFTNDVILRHVELAMDILNKHYPHEKHVFVFDNATTHLKRADDALSGRKMSKYPMKPGQPLFGVERAVIGANGKPVYGANGKVLKEKVRMAYGQNTATSEPQSFYFPAGHEREGAFIGMVNILNERGFDYKEVNVLCAECPKFACPKGAEHCCCRRLLYNQPDFANIKLRLELACEAHGFQVLFLPKFHCELNFIEQCWGYAKQCDIIVALDSVPLETMQRFVNRSLWFMDAYRHGLNGKQAAFATKKYRGHCTLPVSILDDFENLGHPPTSAT
ncbi:hypothetical protein BV22DRAFT_1107991 [Leucogyrophana mollusca]|uniref:Uncharacterized protein n=1 Tax=Leucogyrophana mollusca TaxID=85980 RepID=A0ACB8B2C4_9AGAM|nr:hypothetical protein BV22DRAFT_1107991 [Leucogyrophana mollusca]